MNDEALVIKCNIMLRKKDMDELDKHIQEGIKNGYVLLPYYCEAIKVPKDIQVDILHRDEEESALCDFAPIRKSFNW